MKTLNEYPTPRTDYVVEHCAPNPEFADCARDLERRIGMLREAMSDLVAGYAADLENEFSTVGNPHPTTAALDAARAALEVTKLRTTT